MTRFRLQPLFLLLWPFKVRWLHPLFFLMLAAPVASLASPSSQSIEQQLRILTPYQSHIQQRLEQFSPLIQQIFHQLEEQTLPVSLALVPMLESSYDPKAVSHANAAGLWQLMPATAQRFGLTVTAQQDQRFDTDASTRAAIRYLAFLYRKFDGDMALTLAAYNAGEGRVARAIKAAGSRSFPELTLPQETQTYVSRFYALSHLIDINQLRRETFSPLFLFGGQQPNTTRPLIDLTPLPPLISL